MNRILASQPFTCRPVCFCLALFTLIGGNAGARRATASPAPPERIYTDPAPAVDRYFGPISAISDKYVGVLGVRHSASKPVKYSAYIFDAVTGDHLQTFTHMVPANDPNYRFSSIAIDGDIAVIGVKSHVTLPGGIAYYAGAAYVYDLSTGQLQHKFISDTPQGNRYLGTSVDILGNKIVVGGWGDAYVFDAVTGQQLARLNPSEPTGQFGISVGISESAIIVGSNSDTTQGQFTGAVFTFDPNSYAQINKYVPSDAAASDNFGIEVAIDGQYAIASSTRRAYVFDALTGAEIRTLTLPGNPNTYPHRVDIEGTTALLGNPESKRANSFDWTTGELLRNLVPESPASAPNFGACVSISGQHIIVGAIGKTFQFSVVPEPTAFYLLCGSLLGVIYRRR